MLACDLVGVIEDRRLDLNAKDPLHALENIQSVTIHLGVSSIDRTSMPNPAQARILASLTTEAA